MVVPSSPVPTTQVAPLSPNGGGSHSGELQRTPLRSRRSSDSEAIQPRSTGEPSMKENPFLTREERTQANLSKSRLTENLEKLEMITPKTMTVPGGHGADPFGKRIVPPATSILKKASFLTVPAINSKERIDGIIKPVMRHIAAHTQNLFYFDTAEEDPTTYKLCNQQGIVPLYSKFCFTEDEKERIINMNKTQFLNESTNIF